MALGTAKEVHDHLTAKHGFPRIIISDRGPQFASRLMKEITGMMGVQQNLSTAYHPQMDGQTECVNQEIEQYLQIYIHHRQEDWVEWLPVAEFSYNDKIHMATSYSPFQLTEGHHP